MKNLRGYKPEQNATGSSSQAGMSPEEMLKNYENMSEDALFEKLMSDVASSKSNGTFSPQQLTDGVEKMKPFLSDTQKTKIEHLMRMIISN